MKELAKSKSAQKRGDELAFTQQKEIASSILSAKQEERRERRPAKGMRVRKTEAKWTGLTAQLFDDGGNFVVLKEADGCDAGGSGFEAGVSISNCDTAQCQDWKIREACFAEKLKACGMRIWFFEDGGEDREVCGADGGSI